MSYPIRLGTETSGIPIAHMKMIFAFSDAHIVFNFGLRFIKPWFWSVSFYKLLICYKIETEVLVLVRDQSATVLFYLGFTTAPQITIKSRTTPILVFGCIYNLYK